MREEGWATMADDRYMRIVELESDDAITAVLEQDRVWAAYALCDLEPPHRAYARYVGLVRDGHATAVLLLYAPPGFTSLSVYGSAADATTLLAQAPNLPTAAVFLLRRGDLPALATRYHVDKEWTMLRFAVTPATLRPSPDLDVDVDVRPLSTADLPELRWFYALWPETVFTPLMLERGVYYGAYADDRLVAAAGTHAYAPRHRIAMIGNVFTHPAHRGRGLATATTSAVAHALVRVGVRDIGLNVRDDNAPAIAAYGRLGFSLHTAFAEGDAVMREQVSRE